MIIRVAGREFSLKDLGEIIGAGLILIFTGAILLTGVMLVLMGLSRSLSEWSGISIFPPYGKKSFQRPITCKRKTLLI